MKDPNQKEPNLTGSPDGNEIDDFTQKLLDKKAELVLFPDDDFTSSSLEGTMSEAQRKTAETSMLNALDQLRQERGQSTIEEEERQYAKNHPESVDGSHYENQAGSASSSRHEQASSFIPVEPNRYETTKREDHFEKQEKRPRRKKKLYQYPRFWMIVGLIALIAALFGGYVWKVTVYDPAHVADDSQTQAYERLVNFADEYPMKSDAQKKEVVNLEGDYNSLPQAKKDEINEYFQNPKHVGKTFVELLDETRQANLHEQNPELGALLDYARQYTSLDEPGKLDIIHRIDAFNSLNDQGKAEVNQILQDATGKDFMTLYNEAQAQVNAAANNPAPADSAANEPTAQPDAAANPENNDAAGTDGAQPNASVNPNAELENQLNRLYADRANYQQFLADEGMAGTSDEITQQYDAQIAELEAQLGL